MREHSWSGREMEGEKRVVDVKTWLQDGMVWWAPKYEGDRLGEPQTTNITAEQTGEAKKWLREKRGEYGLDEVEEEAA